MLVIARRVQETLVIPSVSATIQVVSVRAHTVRLGVDAPREVTVLRGELSQRPLKPRGNAPPSAPPFDADAAPEEHTLRNHLNNITLALGMLRRQLGPGLEPGTQALLDRVAAECVVLRQDLQAPLAEEINWRAVAPEVAALEGVRP